MFSKKEAVAPATVNQPVSVETYAVSTGAERLRALEAEIIASFEEWMNAQRSSAEKKVLVEFAMSPWMSAAWSAWKSHKFTGSDEAKTIDIAVPEGWPS